MRRQSNCAFPSLLHCARYGRLDPPGRQAAQGLIRDLRLQTTRLIPAV